MQIDFEKEIINSLIRKGRARINNFGQFEIIRYPERMSHDVTKGKMVKRKAVRVLKFRPTKEFKKKINE